MRCALLIYICYLFFPATPLVIIDFVIVLVNAPCLLTSNLHSFVVGIHWY